MRIHLATMRHAAAISALIRPLAKEYIAHELSAEGSDNLLDSITPEAIQGYLDAGFRYHIAEQDGRLHGVVVTRDNQHLFHLFVAEASQRQGLATRLWSVARQACLDGGGDGDFTVNSSRFAIGVYEKLGFVEAGPMAELNGVVFFPMKLDAGGGP